MYKSRKKIFEKELTQVSASGSVVILDTNHLQKLLRDWSRHNTGTSGGGDKPDPNGTTLAGDLARNGVRATDLVTPETTTHGDDGELSQDDGTTNGSGHFFGALDAQTDVSVVISDGDKGLEAGTLTGTSLFLHRHDFEDFVFQRGAQEEIDDFEFL